MTAFANHQASTPKGPARLVGGFSLRDMKRWERFLRAAARHLDAGFTMEQAFQSARSTTSLSPLPSSFFHYLNRGHHLTSALAYAGIRLPGFAWAHLEAGELSGNLPAMMNRLADEISARRKRFLASFFNFRTLWFLVMVVFAVGSLAVTGAVGNLEQSRLESGVSQVVWGIGLGSLWRFFLYAMVPICCLAGLGWFHFYGKQALTRRFAGFEDFRLSLPLSGQLLVEESLTRYAELLAVMIESGLPLPRALEVAQSDLDLPRWQGTFRKVKETVIQGGTLAQGFAKVPRLPRAFLAEINTGEKTGTLPETLRFAAGQMEEASRQKHTTLKVLFMVVLFLVMVLMTLMVVFQGLRSIFGVYENILAILGPSQMLENLSIKTTA